MINNTTCQVCSKPFHVEDNQVRKGKGKFCSRACHGRAKKKASAEKLQDRFEKYIHKTDTCWIWTGGKNTNGYGRMQVSGGVRQVKLAHRLAYEFAYGSIEDGLCVLHKCDVPACVNPAHLFIGSQIDNIDDMNQKGRHGKTGAQGEKHGMSILNESDVRSIREEHSKTKTTMTALAQRFNVSVSTISLIIKRKIWKHV